jgi:outer membrane protein OmpA-like peptidoglycan-associated protein
VKKSLSTLLVIAGMLFATNSYSQWQPSWNLGIGIGGVKGSNEAIVQSFNLQFGLYGLWLNGLAPHLSLEAGIGSAKNSSPDQGHYSENSTNLIPFDLCLRYAPFEGPDWQPYIYAGLGMISYSVKSAPPNAASDAKLSGIAAYLPFGIGIYHVLDDHFAVDVQAGESPSFTDNLNPVHDNRNDAFWGFKIGITYSFNASPPDEFDLGERGSVRILTKVSFDATTAHLNKESDAQLSKVFAALDNHPDYDVEFRAYTDDSGDFNTNMALTHDRAESVKVWFVSRGIFASRISTEGYGPHNPLVQNDTPEHKKQNYRIEIVRMK